MALLEYTISMIMDSISSSKVPVSERLSEISCPGFHIHYTFGILQWYTNKQKKNCYPCLNLHSGLPVNYHYFGQMVGIILHVADKWCYFLNGLCVFTIAVLVVSGDTDRLVPRWNTERVARAIPGAGFEVIKNSGHLPQEERPEEFVSVVERFLRRASGRPNNEQEQVLQAAVWYETSTCR